MLAGMKNTIRTSRPAGLAISAAAYVAALVIAVLVVRATGVSAPLMQLGLGTFAATVVIFAASVAADNSSMYDPYWSLQPLAIAGFYAWTGSGGPSGRQILVTVLVLLYAVRLTSNFYRDWPGLAKEDFRYVDLRRRFGAPLLARQLRGRPPLPDHHGVPRRACRCTRSGALVGTGLGWLDAVATLVDAGGDRPGLRRRRAAA